METFWVVVAYLVILGLPAFALALLIHAWRVVAHQH